MLTPDDLLTLCPYIVKKDGTIVVDRSKTSFPQTQFGERELITRRMISRDKYVKMSNNDLRNGIL